MLVWAQWLLLPRLASQSAAVTSQEAKNEGTNIYLSPEIRQITQHHGSRHVQLQVQS
eukprot:m.41930 g.41930  ORF g.41930 m.41930 type:complete len:57 (+) comp12844_c0_seq54:2-172(+)